MKMYSTREILRQRKSERENIRKFITMAAPTGRP